jgi:RNA polymerase sigma-70 factor, ECF subfamily
MEGHTIGAAWGITAPPGVRLTHLHRVARAWSLLLSLVASERTRTQVTDRASAREVDDAVLRRAQRGDHGAFHEIVDHYEGRLRVLAYQLLRDADQMNDALQDTFVKAWGGLPEFRGDAALGTWLYRICYRICLDQLRRQRVRPVAEELADEPTDSTDDYDGLALREQVSAALGRLPAEQRAVLLLVDRQGYDYGTVAEALDIPVGTVASRLSLARSAMRRLLGPELRKEAQP